MDYDAAVNYLKNSMIYQMSLGSKELFHSNVWAWLIENDKNFIKVFIPSFEIANYKDGENIWARREDKNRDILIWLEDNNGEKQHIVIENKIKALPTVHQLEKYTVNLGDSSFLHGVLTGIGPCILDLEKPDGFDFKKLSGKWSYVNYEEIANKILEIATQSTSGIIKNHFDQIEEYCQILKCINLILDANINKHKNCLTYDCDYESLDALRIADIFKKHKGSQFINYVKDRKNELEELKPEGYWLIIGQSFHNGKTTLDIRFSNWTNDDTPYNLLGVQIEGDQFRIAAEKNIYVEKITADNVYESFKNEWFDDSYDKDKNKTIFGNQTTMKPRKGKKYDAYITDRYCFIYQYYDVSKAGNDYESLFESIKFYISKASTLLKNMQ